MKIYLVEIAKQGFSLGFEMEPTGYWYKSDSEDNFPDRSVDTGLKRVPILRKESAPEKATHICLDNGKERIDFELDEALRAWASLCVDRDSVYAVNFKQMLEVGPPPNDSLQALIREHVAAIEAVDYRHGYKETVTIPLRKWVDSW